MNDLKRLNYIEIPAKDISATKTFFSLIFEWEFEDYGPDYTAFTSETGYGGFYRSDLAACVDSGSVLIVFYTEDLESDYKKIVAAGGVIVKEIFSFPGGRRFHFQEPSGNEFAVWSDHSNKAL